MGFKEAEERSFEKSKLERPETEEEKEAASRLSIFRNRSSRNGRRRIENKKVRIISVVQLGISALLLLLLLLLLLQHSLIVEQQLYPELPDMNTPIRARV
jgi:hypothetical protein